jgi:carbon monoxide dehydrogenase subunit G
MQRVSSVNFQPNPARIVMILEAMVTINGTKQAIWAAITDVENASDTISGIEKVEILEKPENGPVGLKWRETRTIFGKTATEVMWITDAAENEYYKTRAESHGSIYITTMRISEQDGGNVLTMTHDSQPQGIMAKMMCVPMGLVFKGTMRKLIQQDLKDIKKAVEQKGSEGSS